MSPVARQRSERAQERLETWLGRLTTEQKERVDQWANQLEGNNDIWLDNRERWQAELLSLLAERESRPVEPEVHALLLAQLADKNPDFFPQALPLAKHAADNGHLNLPALLDRVISAGQPPMIDSVLARAEVLATEPGAGMVEASRYVVQHIRQWPSLKGLLYLVDLHQDSVEGRGRENLLILRGIIEALQVGAYQFRCGSCGFAGRKLHWQCPTCHGWSTMKPIKDREAI
mgnify:CR=1 FL=1